ncbi:MAG: hypothetical protein CMM01_06355 [Rhodopirellula sp.]|nr:hypothetical protein [Rhodopirellula sp.]
MIKTSEVASLRAESIQKPPGKRLFQNWYNIIPSLGPDGRDSSRTSRQLQNNLNHTTGQPQHRIHAAQLMRSRCLFDLLMRSTNSQTITCIGTETMMMPTMAPGLPTKYLNAANVAVSNVTIPKNSAIENFIT